MANDMETMLLNAGLNRSQRKFCKISGNKCVRLLAPAGSGKTYSILWRCRCLLDAATSSGQSEPHILIVTFTRAAMYELEERISVKPEFLPLRGHITVCTLNSFGWRQIKSTNKELATTARERRAYVTHDLLPLCQRFPALVSALSSPRGKVVNAGTIIDLIDLFKALGFTHLMNKREFHGHTKYLKDIGLDFILQDGYERLWHMEGVQENEAVRKTAVDDFFNFWKKATVQLEKVNRYTLEDQKYWARMNLERAIEEKHFPQGASKFSGIVIDEFQDINPLDLVLIKVAAVYHGHGKTLPITIVGDDDQAIFGWRGTTPQFILCPDKYLNTKFETCVLNTNYRSPKDIVEISGKLISYNKNRVKKEMRSAAKGRAYIKIINRKKESSTMDAVMSLIRKMLANEAPGTIALIGRKQTALFPYQVLLSAENIPYRVDADIDIYEGEAMQNLQKIIRIFMLAKHNINDDIIEDFLFVCDYVGKYAIAKKNRGELIRYLNQERMNTFQDAISAMRICPAAICGNAAEMANAVQALINSKTVYELMNNIINHLRGFDKDYAKKERDAHYKEPQFSRLAEISRKYGDDFSSFIRDIDHARKAGERNRQQDDVRDAEAYKEANKLRVHLVTATRSKGHEYDNVIILDAYNDEWPNAMTDDIEEERRLFYVAITRAKHYLYFVTSDDRVSSRFLLEAGVC